MADTKCKFRTVVPLGAMSQPVMRRAGSGSRYATRYKQCKNDATTSVNIDGQEVECCGTHAKLHRDRGFLP